MTGRTCYRCAVVSVPTTVNGILVDAPGWSTVTVTGLPITNSLVCDGCATAVRRLLATPPDVAERKADAAREDAFRRGYDDGRADALAGVSDELTRAGEAAQGSASELRDTIAGIPGGAA